MICIIALPVLLIMGIFSMRYRILAKEAFECIFHMVTFRPCRSKLDQRIKSGLTGKVMKYHPGFAGFLFRNFEVLSWIFVVIFAASIVFSAWGVYNYAVYGNCNGPVPNAFCVFNEVEKGVGAIEGAVKCNASNAPAMKNANTS
jgi:hypothetical protein